MLLGQGGRCLEGNTAELAQKAGRSPGVAACPRLGRRRVLEAGRGLGHSEGSGQSTQRPALCILPEEGKAEPRVPTDSPSTRHVIGCWADSLLGGKGGLCWLRGACFIFASFFGGVLFFRAVHAGGTWKFPGQGSNRSCSCCPLPQPHRIGAVPHLRPTPQLTATPDP